MSLISKNPTKTQAWKKLAKHHKEIQDIHIKEFFSTDKKRFDKFSIQADDILVDYSKNRITKETLSLLIEFAKEMKLKSGINSMFRGEPINETENRSVLHVALRNMSSRPMKVGKEDVMPEVKKVRNKMKKFCNDFHSGKLRGYSNKKFKTIINIGIGGSDLGPVMVTEALKPYWVSGIEAHFVSNVDGTHIAEILKKVKPEETLFIIASKTFTTQETMRNAETARQWFLKKGGKEKDIAKHFIALSTNIPGAKEFGIAAKNVFQFWDWVGGRYSLSSAIGMSIALTIGYANFRELLGGMHEMDEHFRTATFSKNIPVILALIGIWNTNFLGAESEAILPYDQYLHRFAAYLQQANMESNGKSVDRDGKSIKYQTGPIIWGEPGTNGQHAFYQLIHQGTRLVPCDFIAPAISHNKIADHHKLLMANFFAQTEALMNGKTKEEVKRESNTMIPFKVFDGNRPSNSILIKKITPRALGKLITMYEHKIFVQGYLWNIFSFDQWGVQLGKQLAKNIVSELGGKQLVSSHDSSTNGLINAFKTMRNEK